ncbi:hypothetical protein ACFO5Q_01180 [Kordiimonas lipolytica]|uniref:Uncharacterized protein n=1 Tax=Kordiimonas lipolytica TaxID=1662421 RepID=A0ABV8U6R7_9PROT|nr:hypothetical protein [Kordiimonas lipolytica]
MTDHSFLTVISPIEHRRNDPDGREATIRKTLLAHEQDDSPFTDCPMVHMARIQILDQAVPPMGDTSGAALKSKYLLFAIDIDGRVDDFLDSLYRRDADFVHNVWGQCIGYPDFKGAVFFRRYIDACSFSNPLGYAGFDLSVGDTLLMLTRKNALADFVSAHQGKSDKELQAAWRKSRADLATPNLPKPGSF